MRWPPPRRENDRGRLVAPDAFQDAGELHAADVRVKVRPPGSY